MIVGRFLGPDALAAGASSAILIWLSALLLALEMVWALLSHVTMVLKTTKLRQSVAATVVIGLKLKCLVMILGHFGLYPL